MTSFSESASGLESLEAGLTAIRQGNPIEAISRLEPYLDSDRPEALKAQMALVQAYAQVGRNLDAIALCQRLCESEHDKVRSWANQKLTELSPANDQVGFVPMASLESKRRSVFIPPQTVEVQSSAPVTSEPSTSVQQSAPQNVTAKSTSIPRSEILPFTWRNAERAQRWNALKPINPAKLQWAELGTAIALFATVYGLWVSIVMLPYGWFLLVTRIFRQSADIPNTTVPIGFLVAGLMAVWIGSTWILDQVLKWVYGSRPLTPGEIGHSSPETHRLLQRFCHQRKIPVPQLGVLPTPAPLAFIYGCFPKFTRIVVSQGLLDRLADDEIAAIYAYELGHVAHWNVIWMSGLMAILQIPYSMHLISAIALDRLRHLAQQSLAKTPIFARIFQFGATLLLGVSAISYGLFWLLRWSGLWLSKQRIIYSDRHACNLTGNPNALTRALLKIAIGTTQTIREHQKTDPILEGFELFTPLGYRSALTIGSLLDRVPLASLFTWERSHPHRHWLTLNNSHPLISDRLAQLSSNAQEWHLEPELDIPAESPSRTRTPLFQLGAPFFGIAIGVGIAQVLWFVGQLVYFLGTSRLNWLASDYKLFVSFALLGYGMGTIVRFNRFFPELRNPERLDLEALLTQPNLDPWHPQAICLEGTLLGRTDASNELAQDILLQTETGLIKLHFLSQLGALGNLILQPNRPIDLIGRSVTIRGWFRRGATPWIDVETIKLPNQSPLRAGHQVWSIWVAIGAIVLGLALIL
jgi:Zn-dependent protease with chaperone function